MPMIDDLDDDGFRRAQDSRADITRKLETLGFQYLDMYDNGRERWMGPAGQVKVVSFDEALGVYIDTDQPSAR